MSFEEWFRASHPGISTASIAAVVRLSGEGATIPFLARYRKEATGGLDEVAVQAIREAKESWDEILKRQAFLVAEIDGQKKLTPELCERILSTFDPQALEDLYLPYKKKRKTKATLAKEAGLLPLADWIWDVAHGVASARSEETLETVASSYLNEVTASAGYGDVAAPLAGAQEILIERLSDDERLRQRARQALFSEGALTVRRGEKARPDSKYENYFAYEERLGSLLKPENSHRYLAIRRGWLEGELSASIGGAASDPGFEDRLLFHFEEAAAAGVPSPGSAILKKAARLSLKAHVLVSLEGEAHKALKAVAEDAAIEVFAGNIHKLLLASPFGSKPVLGIDPGIRTGCKLAVVDDSGKYLESAVVHLHDNEAKARAARRLVDMVKKASIRAVAVGNGTAGRETEGFVRGALAEAGLDVPVVLVNESGASVYSASEVAREEFPDLDITIRGAISIARRLQDPLAELVKIDPKSIGVGQYQHDVSEAALRKRLDLVVDVAVNRVGVNLNTASPYLLSRVSGIGPALGKAIVKQREDKGLFRSRKELFDVPRFTRKTFEQAAGFLRIPNGDHPLDNTGVHPERYDALESFAACEGRRVADLLGPGVALVRRSKGLKDEIGAYTYEDILAELEKPGRDPREEFLPFQFRDVHSLEDLKVDMVCPGVVTNVTNFGAFVDIGVHQDGLVHISQLADRFVKDPRDVVSPGDRVQVRVLSVHLAKRQIALSMKRQGIR